MGQVSIPKFVGGREWSWSPESWNGDPEGRYKGNGPWEREGSEMVLLNKTSRRSRDELVDKHIEGCEGCIEWVRTRAS